MGTTQSTPLQGGDVCAVHGTDKRACQLDPRCKRDHHRCVLDHGSKPVCARLSRKECRRHPQCNLANKRCIRKSHKKIAAFYRGSRVHVIHRSNYDPQHYIIEYANGLRASVPMTEVRSISQHQKATNDADELQLHHRFIESLARKLQQYQLHDAASARPTCSPGPWGNHFCRRIGVGQCGPDRRCAPQGACHARCATQPERTVGQRKAKRNCYSNCAKPKATLERWRKAAATKCKERCNLQPERTAQQREMKRRCYNNCRARQ